MSKRIAMNVLCATLVVLCLTQSGAKAFTFGCEPKCGKMEGTVRTWPMVAGLNNTGRAVLGDVGNGLRPGVSRLLKAPGPVYVRPRVLKVLSAPGPIVQRSYAFAARGGFARR